jgi:predicted transcriptional regulator
MTGKNISIRTDAEKLQAIDAMAAQRDRSRNYIINEALDRYLEEERDWVVRVKQGLAEADAGIFASDDEVETFFKAATQAAKTEVAS